MINEVGFNALLTVVSLAALWVLAVWLYRSYRVDLFRQNMFALRDSLFDMGAEGRVDFSHPTYRLLRSMYNGYIRFGHRLSLLSIMLMWLGLRPAQRRWLGKTNGFTEKLRQAMNGLDEDVRRDLHAQQSKMHELVAKHLVFGSPLLVALVVPGALLVVVLYAHMTYARWLRRKLRNFVAEAIDEAALALGEAA